MRTVITPTAHRVAPAGEGTGGMMIQSGRDLVLNERLVAELGLGILALDRRGRIVFANPAGRDVLGLAEDPVGNEASVVLREFPALLELATAGLAVPTARVAEVAFMAGAQPRRLVVRTTPLSEQPAALVLTLLDVTSARLAEDERRRIAALAGLGRFVSYVSHELKNPLGALKLYALLLERQSRDDKPGRAELVGKVARTVDQLSTLIGDLTALAVATQVEPESVALPALVDETLAELSDRLKAGSIEVVRNDDAPGATVWADPRALRQVLARLVANAVEAMPTGGTLTLGVAAGEPREFALTVQDSGCGMPADVQARLFEPFFTTKAGGMGLGMVLARQIIEKLGGRLEVHSRVGLGTTVRIALQAGQAGDHGRRTHPGR